MLWSSSDRRPCRKLKYHTVAIDNCFLQINSTASLIVDLIGSFLFQFFLGGIEGTLYPLLSLDELPLPTTRRVMFRTLSIIQIHRYLAMCVSEQMCYRRCEKVYCYYPK